MTTFSLKILALVLMVIDHIGLFFPFTPIWFRWLGRLSAPLFVFCMVLGFSYTRNKSIYLIRMYLFGLGMSIIDYILNQFTDSNLVANNIFVTLFSIAFIIRLIEYKRENHPKWKIYLLCYFIWQMVSLLICYYIDVHYDKSIYFFIGLLANIFYNEGGFIFVALGITLYYAKNSKRKIALFYTLFCFLYSFITITAIIPRLMTRIDFYGFHNLYNILSFIFPILGFDTIGIYYDSIFYWNFQWMMIGSLPFMLIYNGKKGKSIKYFFYTFYPLHIIILFIISNIIK
ncbi:MAG: TraX family protein [Anaerocolumna sp.]